MSAKASMILTAIIMLVASMFACNMVRESRECESRGGIYVRTAFGMACVQPMSGFK